MNTDIRDRTEVWFVGRRDSALRPRTIERISFTAEDLLLLQKQYISTGEAFLENVEVEVEVGVYHIQGIATTEQMALDMVADPNYFVGPIPVNVALPHERCEWPDMYYPAEKNAATPDEHS